MPSINRPFSHRRGSRGNDLTRDIPGDYRRKVGSWLREKRIDKGLTQAQLGLLLDVGFTAISAVEVGRGSVPPERYIAMADALDIDHQEFGWQMLRFSNPWAYFMIREPELSRGERSRLLDEISQMPARVGHSPGPRS